MGPREGRQAMRLVSLVIWRHRLVTIRACNDCHVALSNTPTTKIDKAVVQIPSFGIKIKSWEKDGKANNGNHGNAALR